MTQDCVSLPPAPRRLWAATLLVGVATSFTAECMARPRAVLLAQMTMPAPVPMRIESGPATIERITPNAAVQQTIEARPRDDQPQIVAPPLSSTVLAERDMRSANLDKELKRLMQTAEAPRTVGSTPSSAQAAWLLGLIYLHGAGVRRDPAMAQRWFEQAARFGRETWAYAGLAWCHIDGCVGPPDPAAAARAIAQLRPRHPARADFLEWVLASRQTPLQLAKPEVSEDQTMQLQNKQLLDKAAAAGDVQANVELGMLAVANRQIDQAEAYFRRAGPTSQAAQANLRELAARNDAQQIRAPLPTPKSAADALAMARKYHRGEGVPANFVEAIRFYQLADARGSVEARRMLALINSRPAPGGGFNAGWMQQLAYVDAGTTIPSVGVVGTAHMLQREPTPLYDLLPSFWRQQLTQISR